MSRMNLERGYLWLVSHSKFILDKWNKADQSKIFSNGLKMNIDNLLPNELKELIDKLKLKLNDDENSKNTIAKIADRERQKNTCPKCGKSHVVKDGLYKGRQKYKCKDCGKKFH